VDIFVLGRHLGFGNCGGLGRGKICRGSRREVMGEGGGGGERKMSFQLPVKHPITIQDGGIENLVYQNLSSVPFQNNACTAS